MSRITLSLRHAKRGNFRPARLFIRNAGYGLTHWRCVRCNTRKGPTVYRLCDKCAVDNLFRYLFDEEAA